MTTTNPTHNQDTPDEHTQKEYRLSASQASERVDRRWLPTSLPRAWLYAYIATWIATLTPAVLIALAGRALTLLVRRLLGLALLAHRNPPPRIGHVLALAAHNIPIAAWPLLLGLMGAHRHRLTMHVADGVLVACMILNTLPVGAALGAYGATLLPYVPQLPLEWAGLALGASAWLVQRHRALTVTERLWLLALSSGVLLCAAVLETVAVPHR
jgi:hypothetical protein